MEGFADALGEAALLPGAVVGGAQREQNVVRPEASNSVGERAERRLVPEATRCGNFWSQRLNMAHHCLQSLIGLVPHPIGIRDQPLKPTRQHRCHDQNLGGRLDQRPHERRRLVLRRTGGQGIAETRRDLWVALALAASWLAIWGLYSTYTWTTDPTNGSVGDVRFYVPALGAIALLGAWLVTRLPGRAWLAGLTSTATIATLFGLGVWAFYAMYAAVGVPLHR